MINMMRLQKGIRGFFCICLFLSSFLIAQGDGALSQFADFDIDVSTVDVFDKIQSTRRVPAADKALVDTMVNLEGAVKDSIWHNTKAPTGRDILYLLPYKISALERGGFAFNLFFNMTNKMNVGVKSLLNPEAVNLDRLASDIIPFLPKGTINASLGANELASLLALFKEITLQERKIGAMIQFGFIKGPFTVQIHTPIHMTERNFWLSPQDRQSISRMLKSDDSSSFSDDELIRFRYGAGDTRLKIGLNTVNMPNFQTDLGVETIIPTSRFAYTGRYKTASTQDVETAESFGKNLFNVLRGVRDYMLDPRMGNNGHFGFGCYMEAKANVFHNLANIWTRFSYDRLIPGEEERLIMHKKTVADGALAALDGKMADEKGVESIALMKQFRQTSSKFVEERLFPRVYTTTVSPGGIFNAVFAISTDIKKMQFSLGYDFYTQQAELIKKVHNTNATLDELRIDDAQSLRVYQHKVFTEALYIKKLKRCDMGFGLGGDMTVASQGIGQDWTAYAKITTSF